MLILHQSKKVFFQRMNGECVPAIVLSNVYKSTFSKSHKNLQHLFVFCNVLNAIIGLMGEWGKNESNGVQT